MHLSLTGAVARSRWSLVGIVAFAFAARLIYRLAHGEDAFLTHGYTFYRHLAASFLSGDGLCLDPGVGCAVRVPIYPLFVSAFLSWDWLYPGLPLAQAAISAGRCVIAYGIGVTLFDRRAGVLAACITAVNPYAIAHATALQDTSLFNLLIALAVYLLLRSREPERGWLFTVMGGVILGLATLTTVRLALFVPLALAWVALPSAPGGRWRLREAVLMAVPVIVLIGGWMSRNWHQVGSPVLTTEWGESLWVANHPVTLEYLPERSVDEIYDVAVARLPAARKSLLASRLSEVEFDSLLGRWAIEYMWTNPEETLAGMVQKVAFAFSGQLSPARGPWVQVAYAAFVVPLHVLAAIGWWRARRTGKGLEHLLIGSLFAAFIVTTAVFWAHTSHKSTLHIFLGVYAAFAISAMLPPFRRQEGPVG